MDTKPGSALDEFLDNMFALLEWIEPQANGDRQRIQVVVASYFLRFALGTDWHDKYVRLSDTPDPWLLNATDKWYLANRPDEVARRSVFSYRIVRLANAFFTLIKRGTSASAFELLRRRLQTAPDVQPTFVEIEVASFLVRNGAEVRVIEESGIRGQDFDFLAISDGMEVSVEVTSLRHRPLTVQTISNKFKEKRSQVPDGRPAVLYMGIPAEWMVDSATAYSVFTEAATRFMRGSHRYNAFTLLWEAEVLSGTRPATRLTTQSCYHNNPRHRLSGGTVFDMQSEAADRGMADSLLEFLEAVRAKRAATKPK